MQSRAQAAGLAFSERKVPARGAELDAPNPSYRRFMFGLYKFFSRKYERQVGGGINETIDPTVWSRWCARPGYRPRPIETALQAGLLEPGSCRVA
jgi:hypothetical protein